MGIAKFEITGPTKIGLRFEEFPDELRDALRATITDLAKEAFSLVAAGVPHRTGRLASEERLEIIDEPGKISGVVNFDGAGATSNDFKKAGALEYGSTGKSFEIQGYTIDRTHVFDKILAAPYQAVVKAYERTPNITETPFVRPVAATMQATALAQMTVVADQAIIKFNNAD